MSFETIQEFYQLGLWDAQQLQQLVQAGGLTAEQYQQITGQVYPVPETKVINETHQTENRTTTQENRTTTHEIQSTGSPQGTGVAQG